VLGGGGQVTSDRGLTAGRRSGLLIVCWPLVGRMGPGARHVARKAGTDRHLVAVGCSASRASCRWRSWVRTGNRARQVAWFGFGSVFSLDVVAVAVDWPYGRP
jgi:hypothetical protein